MVKKISGRPSAGKTSSTTPVQSTKTVGSAKVGTVGGVKNAEGAKGTQSTDGVGRELTPQMRDEIFQLIDEVADNMFNESKGFSEKKKKTLKDAVKMAIDAGMVEE
jgi:hypothetical protein